VRLPGSRVCSRANWFDREGRVRRHGLGFAAEDFGDHSVVPFLAEGGAGGLRYAGSVQLRSLVQGRSCFMRTAELKQGNRPHEAGGYLEVPELGDLRKTTVGACKGFPGMIAAQVGQCHGQMGVGFNPLAACQCGGSIGQIAGRVLIGPGHRQKQAGLGCPLGGGGVIRPAESFQHPAAEGLIAVVVSGPGQDGHAAIPRMIVARAQFDQPLDGAAKG
jgi:hypothetical protein